MKLEHIIESIRRDRLRIKEHADEEAQDDRLSFDEILASVLDGEIIEEYPDDKPFPSCLILGETADGEPVHSVQILERASRISQHLPSRNGGDGIVCEACDRGWLQAYPQRYGEVS